MTNTDYRATVPFKDITLGHEVLNQPLAIQERVVSAVRTAPPRNNDLSHETFVVEVDGILYRAAVDGWDEDEMSYPPDPNNPASRSLFVWKDGEY